MAATREPLVIKEYDSTSAVAVTLSDVRRHADAVTVFKVRLRSEDLTAESVVESIDGDEGYRPEPAASSTPGMTVHDAVRLSTFLRALAQTPIPWIGPHGWHSLDGDLTVDAICDSTGRATLVIGLEPRPWDPQWHASVRLHYALGDLERIGRVIERWFDDAMHG